MTKMITFLFKTNQSYSFDWTCNYLGAELSGVHDESARGNGFAF